MSAPTPPEMPQPSAPTPSWDDLLNRGTEHIQRAFHELVAATSDYAGHSPDLIWGNLQTPEYAREVLRMVANLHQLPDDSRAGAAERTARARYLGQGGRTYHVLLGEQALLTGIGGPEVMRAQLEHLLATLDTPGLRLGIIPARARLNIYPGDGFGIHDGTRVEVEGYRGCETITDPKRVGLFHRAFRLLQESAVYGPGARALITEALHGW
ncbi:DUF5753 domain-containing protein [Kitasatospora sp. NPDC098663]|uniref:DUF5753 domain-containing protein n=1 Tax=Kitasatospora sp. NPDC098663 TaxID=3364096 RepID=UPI0037FDE240